MKSILPFSEGTLFCTHSNLWRLAVLDLEQSHTPGVIRDADQMSSNTRVGSDTHRDHSVSQPTLDVPSVSHLVPEATKNLDSTCWVCFLVEKFLSFLGYWTWFVFVS